MTEEVRFYRRYFSGSDLVSFNVVLQETDLWIGVDGKVYRRSLEQEVEEVMQKERCQLERYLAANPAFKNAMHPVSVNYSHEEPPAVVTHMVRASLTPRVGPMAAVAGTFAEIAGKYLVDRGADAVIVENGGDIFLYTTQTRRIGIYAGKSPLSGRIGLEISPEDTPLGICTSSGTVGHSFSRGRADAVIVLAPSVPLADAAATALGNLVQDKHDVEAVVQRGGELEGISGVLAICEDRMAAWGNVRLCKLSSLEN